MDCYAIIHTAFFIIWWPCQPLWLRCGKQNRAQIQSNPIDKLILTLIWCVGEMIFELGHYQSFTEQHFGTKKPHCSILINDQWCELVQVCHKHVCNDFGRSLGRKACAIPTALIPVGRPSWQMSSALGSAGWNGGEGRVWGAGKSRERSNSVTGGVGAAEENSAIT